MLLSNNAVFFTNYLIHNSNYDQIQTLLSLSSAIRLFLLSPLGYNVVGAGGCGKGVPMDLLTQGRESR